MRKLTIMLGIGLLGAAAIVLSGSMPEATAAKNPVKASARCRKVIGDSVFQMTGAALKAIERCHALRLKKGSSVDCNVLEGNPTYTRGETRALARMRSACKEGDPVLENYGGAIPIPRFTLGVMRQELEKSAAALQGSPTFGGDKKTVKGQRKCHAALGAGRTLVVQGALKSAVKCQQRLDKRAQSFGPIDPSCLGGAGAAGGKASGKISKACGAFRSDEIGSCDGLPGCLVTSAERTARTLALLAYGGPQVCGNGILQPGEQCDDGNTNDGDGCSSTCRTEGPGTCGDGIVNQPDEECDDDNSFGNRADEPEEACYQCKLNVCGDGFVNREGPIVEECDDGNDVPGDGCTGCKLDGSACDANGTITATLGLDYPQGLVGGLSGIRFALGYSASVSIPGSGSAASVRSRVSNLLGSAFSLSMVRDSDADNDGTDDSIGLQITSTFESIKPGAVATVQFDCNPGEAVQPDEFRCELSGHTGLDGLPLEPELASRVGCTLELSGAPVTTTTTSTTTVTTVSTTTTTTPPLCGNGVLDPGEECDDGNLNPNDGCTGFCTICGNGVVTAPETCDDGNFDSLDNCPSNCRIESCAPGTATQTISVRANRPDLTSVLFFLDYPDGRVELPGEGEDVVASFSDAAGTLTPLDLEYAVRVLVSEGFEFETTLLTRVTFRSCAGSNLPAAGDYKCTVLSASDGTFQDVTGVTCTVTIP